MNILALDLGTVMGWAVLTPSGSIESGVFDFRPKRHQSENVRFFTFQKNLKRLYEEHAFSAVYYEAVQRHSATYAAQVYGGFLATLHVWCQQNELPCQGIPVGTIKRHATGKGNANKLDMVNAMEKRGHKVKDDNEADALALLYCVMEGK
jgi:Holliday junction resolvasome RuvABC endonuclease subunit